MLKTALCIIAGSLMTTKSETSSYLDAIDPANDITASNGWFVTSVDAAGDALIDGNFIWKRMHTTGSGNDQSYVRIDLLR